MWGDGRDRDDLQRLVERKGAGEAVRLVEFAWQNAQQGDLFVRKAPACTVQDLAEAMRQLFEVDLPIEVQHSHVIDQNLGLSGPHLHEVTELFSLHTVA